MRAWHGRVDLFAAADHAIVEGHQLDWKSAKVIDREKRWRSRKVKEALWIRNTEYVHSDQGQGMGNRRTIYGLAFCKVFKNCF